jgi:predicted dehydrogenase
VVGKGQSKPDDERLRFAILGTGFWSRFQLAAWQELSGAQCVALYNRTRAKAESLAREFNVPAVYDDPAQLLRYERVDFVDIITSVQIHAPLVELAARHHVPAVCQKPLATSLAEAQRMVKTCERSGVPLIVHENWRWQHPIRCLKAILNEGRLGRPFRARIDMLSGFPVFSNQPALRELEQFILTDMGTHILDTARFLFGEATQLYCSTRQVHSDIRGEDVATVVMEMGGGQTTVICEMAYAENYLERECFPQTLIFIEATKGSLELAPDYWIRTTTREGCQARRHAPKYYPWIDPAYAVVQSSIVECNANILNAIRKGEPAETDAHDNLKTLQLVFDAYASAREGRIIHYDTKHSSDPGCVLT